MSFIIWSVGSILIGGVVYVMTKEYFKYLNNEEDIEVYGNDRTRIRHEEGI